MQPVDAAIVLAVDASASVDFVEFSLMLGGFASALRDPTVIVAATSGPRRAVALSAMFWSEAQAVAVDWARVDGPEAAEAFAAQLDAAPRLVRPAATALGEALVTALRLLARCPAAAARGVIDVSGDGQSNRGRPPAGPRDVAVGSGVTINGLAILNEEPALLEHYRSEVIGGPGAFALSAADYQAFAEAMRAKLLQEFRGPGAAIT
jgi:hypothetical protein